MKFLEINDFAKRHIANSQYSHFEGSWDELTALVEKYWDTAKEIKPGIFEVNLPTDGFFTSVVAIKNNMTLSAFFEARRSGEAPYINVVVNEGEKIPAEDVKVIVYTHKVLGDDATTDADYEIVTIIASPYEGESIPQHYMSMARNYLDLPGGTKAEYSSDNFAKSIIFWSKHALLKIE